MSRQSSSLSSSSTAISTVFSLPELVEAILIALGETHILDSNANNNTNKTLPDIKAGSDMSNFVIEPIPVMQLFPLQRINHTFAKVIQRSTELRGMMGLTALLSRCGGSEGGCSEGMSGMDGLSIFIGTMRLTNDAVLIDGGGRGFGIGDLSGGEDGMLGEIWKVGGASWRVLQFFCSSAVEEIWVTEVEGEKKEEKKKQRVFFHVHLRPPRETDFQQGWTVRPWTMHMADGNDHGNANLRLAVSRGSWGGH